MNVKIAVCDDEWAEINYLLLNLRKWAKNNGIKINVLSFANAEDLLMNYKNINPDILLLDIQMQELNGIELAKKIRTEYKNETVQIIFITGYPDYIAEGYDVSALHYLMKPVAENKLFEVLDKAAERLNKAEQILVVRVPDGSVKLPLNDILYIEAFAHYVIIQTKTTAIETRANISEIEKSTRDAFVRCHRSYIVGLNHISRITKTDVILDNGKIIPLSRRLYTAINLAFIEYHKGRRK